MGVKHKCGYIKCEYRVKYSKWYARTNENNNDNPRMRMLELQMTEKKRKNESGKGFTKCARGTQCQAPPRWPAERA